MVNILKKTNISDSMVTETVRLLQDQTSNFGSNRHCVRETEMELERTPISRAKPNKPKVSI